MKQNNNNTNNSSNKTAKENKMENELHGTWIFVDIDCLPMPPLKRKGFRMSETVLVSKETPACISHTTDQSSPTLSSAPPSSLSNKSIFFNDFFARLTLVNIDSR